jgi:hypothetical protein
LDLTEGDIHVENFSGSLFASVLNGSLFASLFDLRDEDEIVIESNEGNISLTLQENLNARLLLVCPEGDIMCDFDIDIPLGEKMVDAQLGKNGPRISLTASRGDIRIKK